MNLNMFFNLGWIWSKKTSLSNFYKENHFKLCLTKHLLNMFKLWCERGIILVFVMFFYCSIRALANEDTNLCPGHKKGFRFCSETYLCPQQMFPSLRSPGNIMGNNVSATMCPRDVHTQKYFFISNLPKDFQYALQQWNLTFNFSEK